MNASHMKNIIVLRDLPSNIIDEAIVILKAGSKLKNAEKIENRKNANFDDEGNSSYEIAIKEAELLVADYMKNLEKPKENSVNMKKLHIKYQKLKVYSLFLGIIALIRSNCEFIEIEEFFETSLFFGLILIFRTYILNIIFAKEN